MGNEQNDSDCQDRRINTRGQMRPKTYKRRLKKAQLITNIGQEEIDSDDEQPSNKFRAVQRDENLFPLNSVAIAHNIEISDTVLTETYSDSSEYNDANDAEICSSNNVDIELQNENELNSEFFNEIINGEFNENCDESLTDRLLNELGQSNSEETSGSEDEISLDKENDYLNQPITPGHKLSLKTGILVIWLYAISNGLTTGQLENLLSLVNLFLVVAHPVFKSLYRFKRAFNKNFSSGLKKHFFCSDCNQTCDESVKRCSNNLCRSVLKDKRGHFIELDVISQLKILFEREDFIEGVKYPETRRKKNEHNIEDVYDGEHYKSLFKDKDTDSTNLSFVFNTDGVPIFRSSNTSIWPIFLMVNELPFKMRTNRDFMILAGLWYGPSKPVMNIFLQPMLDSFISLQSGVKLGNHFVRAFIHSMSCDLPAMSSVLNTMSHTGEFSCIKCFQSGSNFRTENGGNVRIFKYNLDNPAGPVRQHEDVISDAELAVNEKLKHSNGIKGPSVLMLVPKFDCVKSVAKDYMHMIHLGINRMLMKLWFGSEHSQQRYSIIKDLKVVDERISKVKLPHVITRSPRSISEHLPNWKASEHRAWFFFYAIPCLEGIMTIPYLYHYYALIQGIFLLNQSSISLKDIAEADRLLSYFVFMLPSLYSEKCLTLNAHSLLHLPQIVKELGPLWSFSCFAFEGANGDLLKMFNGTQYIDLQIANAVAIFQMLPTLGKDVHLNDTAYSFVKSLMRTVDFKQSDSIETKGNPFKKQLDWPTKLKIQQYIECEMNKDNVLFYKRIKINGLVYQSVSYTRVEKRNSFSVRFHFEGAIHYGFVLLFGKYIGRTHKELFACIELFEPTNNNIFSNGPDDNGDLAQNIYKLDKELFYFMKSTKRNCIVSASDIIGMCICVELENKVCFAKEPNTYERNL